VTERFRIGEIAILVLQPGETPNRCWLPYIGQEVEVVGALRKREFRNCDSVAAHVVLARDGRRFGAQPCNLRKKRLPPTPREEVGEWELCPWQPKHSTVSAVTREA